MISHLDYDVSTVIENSSQIAAAGFTAGSFSK